MTLKCLGERKGWRVEAVEAKCLDAYRTFSIAKVTASSLHPSTASTTRFQAGNA